ncbi:MAG: hypothetical protein L0Z73_01730 [Gammaproteobacteria bacterium]|nr:hypothetical protein [Gammaproteobacteria bacterium]
MVNNITVHKGSQFTRMLVYGVISLSLYFLLYLFEDEIQAFSSQGRWFFIAPVIIAFVFSFAHGNFTSYFWDTLGITAKK